MTLEKHEIQGIPQFKCKVVDSSQFEEMMQKAGYFITGLQRKATELKFGGRILNIKELNQYIYSLSRTEVITAYHV